MPKSTPEATSIPPERSEEHTSELQSRLHLVCRLLLEKKKTQASVAAALPADPPTCAPISSGITHCCPLRLPSYAPATPSVIVHIVSLSFCGRLSAAL